MNLLVIRREKEIQWSFPVLKYSLNEDFRIPSLQYLFTISILIKKKKIRILSPILLGPSSGRERWELVPEHPSSPGLLNWLYVLQTCLRMESACFCMRSWQSFPTRSLPLLIATPQEGDPVSFSWTTTPLCLLEANFIQIYF